MLRTYCSWAVLAALVVGVDTSAGDRDLVFIDCLDTCAAELCGIRYIREPSDVEPNKRQLRQQEQLRRKLQEYLRANHLETSARDPLASGSGDGAGAGTGDIEALHRDLRVEGHSGPTAITGQALDAAGSHAGWSGTEPRGGVSSGAGTGSRGDPASRDGERFAHSPPWHLRAMAWDCPSECKYVCMTMHVEERMAWGQRVQQYYGKWPFRRVWGIQELFSSLFSAGNGLPHLYHLLFSRGQYNPKGDFMSFWLSVYPWMGINTWLWSTVFHARDVRWTEAADYFCALMNIFFVVWVALLRTAGPPEQRRPRVRKALPWVGCLMSGYYVLHVGYLWFVKFDYGYNMKVALVAGLAHTALWLRYQHRIRDRAYAKRGAVSIILLNAAILLEVGDFPPVAYRLVDAHAIWHLVTIPLVFSWYRFLIDDAQHAALLKEGKAT